ncbi:DNA polymerase iota isoform X2 [Calypte anna]|uniref:DNA polymerase iota isoform X2 n=1 Tax=Calypte anna TaxID=9244 RepID=UPI0011C3D43F|nr:DNA polymerase iota isoform X2 [Calypte anna]
MEPFPPPTEEQEEKDEEEEEGGCFYPQPGGGDAPPASWTRSRVILHLDLDCFYAQVEMIRNPALRNKPLGVQQKSIVVTCNYEARKLGVKKLMSVKDAKEKCPQLVLVNGEDLTPYREMSYKVTELLGEFCPLVERLGFDENFVDITEIAEKRLNQLQQRGCSQICVSGHVYNNQAINLQDPRHLRLVMGSQVAEEFREAICARLGLTGCAGVASNKLLAKLVSGTFKPNQQTLLLPESCQELMHSLEHIQKVPGIGSRTAQGLAVLGVRGVCDLQAFPPALLEKEFGASVAQRIQKLSYGEDDSPVTPSGPPQSFSDEDSFKKCSSEAEVQEKIEELLPKLLDRIQKDGRQPQTVRLSIRRFSSPGKRPNRESRQCPVPPHLIHRFGKESSKVLSPWVALLMKLFRKMVAVELPFHLTLLSICFSNLRELPSSKEGSIASYLKQMAPTSGSAKRGWDVEATSGVEGSASWTQDCDKIGTTKMRKLSEEKQSNREKAGVPDLPFYLPAAAIDQEVFKELPEAIQKEIISEKAAVIPPGNVLGEPAVGFAEEGSRIFGMPLNSEGLSSDSAGCSKALPSAPEPAALLAPRASCSSAWPTLTSSRVEKQPLNSRGKVLSALEAREGQRVEGVPGLDKEEQIFGTTFEEKTCRRQTGIVLPPDVDTKTFYELPAELQAELLAEWKNQDPLPQNSKAKSPEKPKNNKGRRKAASCLSQSNSLLRYFKPQ